VFIMQLLHDFKGDRQQDFEFSTLLVVGWLVINGSSCSFMVSVTGDGNQTSLIVLSLSQAQIPFRSPFLSLLHARSSKSPIWSTIKDTFHCYVVLVCRSRMKVSYVLWLRLTITIHDLHELYYAAAAGSMNSHFPLRQGSSSHFNYFETGDAPYIEHYRTAGIY
jgi:hypothetical protein